MKIHDIARDNLIKSSDRQKRSYDFRKNVEVYQVGDTVFLHNTARKSGTSSKFHLPWSGPFLVVKKISDLVYGIQRSSKADIKYVHHDRLKPASVKLDDWTVSPVVDTVAKSDDVLVVDQVAEGDVESMLTKDSDDVSLHQEDVPGDLVSFSCPVNEGVELLREAGGKTLVSDPHQTEVGSDVASVPDAVDNKMELPVTRRGRRVKPPEYLKDYDCDFQF